MRAPKSPLNRSKKKKAKLKILAIGKENASDAQDHWYQKKFRQPYTLNEERAIIKFFLDEGGYSNHRYIVNGLVFSWCSFNFLLFRGTRIWKEMENASVCPGRTWQSLKNRWEKNILSRLDTFGVSVEQLEEADRDSDNDEDSRSNTSRQSNGMRGYRKNANYYTVDDDAKVQTTNSNSSCGSDQ